LLIALILDSGKGTLKGLCQYLPAKLTYWTRMRMIRSGQWEAEILVARMAHDVLRYLPAPADGLIHLSGDATRQDNRGQKHPLGLFRRESDPVPYTFGFDMVVLIASWDHVRLPMAIAPIDPDIKGHQNTLFRHMLATFEPPSWVQEVIVTGDAGFCANKTLPLINNKGWTYVFPCHGRENSPMANMSAIWSIICPGTVMVDVRHIPQMGAAAISGCFSDVPR
jgi:hypothetical protein